LGDGEGIEGEWVAGPDWAGRIASSVYFPDKFIYLILKTQKLVE